MRMSDTVTVHETSETMRGLEAEESSSAPGGDGLDKSESREHVEPNGEENCYDEKSETQVGLYEERYTKFLPSALTMQEWIFALDGERRLRR